MSTLIEWLRAQGNAGAVANAHSMRTERRREERLVRSLVLRLPPVATGTASQARRTA